MIDRAVVAPAELAIHLTYRCPLSCAHCCFSSDMSQHGHLDREIAIGAVEAAAAVEGMERINFVGGDPFLQTDLMADVLGRAKNLGLDGSATTSAYWATSERKALQVLAPLVQAGLSRLIISYDDMHARFLKIKHVVNAYRSARQLGIDVCVAVVLQPGSKIDAGHVYDALGVAPHDDPGLTIYETAISSTGRAREGVEEDELFARRQAPQVYRGPCSSVLRDFSVTPEGQVLPCCGVLPFRQEMVVGDLNREPLRAAIDRAYNDAAMKWIALEGPVALLCEITAESDTPFAEDDFDGVCHACDVLYSSPELLQRLRDYLPRKMAMLEQAEGALAAIGYFRRRDEPQSALVNAGQGSKEDAAIAK